LNKFKDHPQLSKLSKKEQETQIREYLTNVETKKVVDGIVEGGLKKGDLVIFYPKPKEPLYNVTIASHDFVRYGPKDSDLKPMGCEKNCPITIVEYSEFECPFCAKVIPTVDKVMSKYKGKIRWAVRDFPLSFHQKAKPAAVAAHCAGAQKKYFHMYTALFEDQRNLSTKDFDRHAKKMGLDMKKFKACTSNPKVVHAAIDRNFKSGAKNGVTGTPAFFINGRRLSGALPYTEFERVIEEELKNRNSKA
jgi:protein-disulfide isomerase